MRYAATTVDGTPPTTVPRAGYVARKPVPATGTHDRLTASLLWLAGPREDSSSVQKATEATLRVSPELRTMSV